jgi:hypothetical protein
MSLRVGNPGIVARTARFLVTCGSHPSAMGRDGERSMRSENVKGHRPGNDPPPSKVERVGRVCREPDCDTRLSIYNKSGFCWQHQPLIFPNYRGKRLASS